MFGTTQDITDRKKAETSLHKSEERYRQIVETAQEGIWMLDENNNTIFVNRKMCEMLEYSREEMMGKQNYYFKDEEGKRKALEDTERRKQGITETQVSKFISKSGKTIWTSVSTNPIIDDEGKYIGALGMFTDITARKKADEELLEAQQKYQTIFDNTADGIYQSTAGGKFIMVNLSMARIFGYDSPEDLISSVTDIGTQIYANPDQRKKMSELILAQGHVENYELQVLTKNKKIIWVSANIRIVRHEDGSISYFEGTLEDITERKRSEEQLLNMSNRLQLAVHATSIGIWDWDVVNNNTVWDDEMYRIYDVQQNDPGTITEAWEATLHPDDFESVKEALQKALRGEKEYDTEFRIIWKDKTIHYVKGNALVQRDQAGNAIRMIGTNTDITERKEAEEEILLLNRNLDQFANITAHDLQEPIRMVSGFLGLLHKKYNDQIDEQGKSYIERAKDGADRMSILIKDLLEFSRSGNKAAKKELVDIGYVMDLVDKDLSIIMADTGTILRIPSLLPEVTGTQSALYRLFLNLISNGIKFRKKDTVPEVNLTVKELPDCWEFTLQDNGIGIEEKDQPKLFQAFQRLHRREDYPGTGLGLVTCKKIVELHGGKIWITSEHGKGTAFHFTIKKAA
jgi:PAS domain S-box-containing protein